MIIVREGETLDAALRRFKKETMREGTLFELKKREYYLAPSAKRKAKDKAAARRIKKKAPKVKLY